MRHILKIIDASTEWAGKGARWLTVFLIIAIVIEVFMRYVLNSPTIWAYEISMMLGASLYSIGFAYTEKQRAHVRVDIFYHKYSDREKAISDAILALLFFLPVVLVTAWGAWAWMIKSWSIGEKSVESFWYPPLSPLRTLICIGWLLLISQGLAGIYRNFYYWIKGRPYV